MATVSWWRDQIEKALLGAKFVYVIVAVTVMVSVVAFWSLVRRPRR